MAGNITKAESPDMSGYRHEAASTVGYGDTVVLLDTASNELFEIHIESNPANRHLMKDIETKLLGLSNNQRFTYAGYTYRIQEIRKREEITENEI